VLSLPWNLSWVAQELRGDIKAIAIAGGRSPDHGLICIGFGRAASQSALDNTALIAVRRQRQANMHRQSVRGSVFRLDCSPHRLDIAACDR
jgi:hypothetical protein